MIDPLGFVLLFLGFMNPDLSAAQSGSPFTTRATGNAQSVIVKNKLNPIGIFPPDFNSDGILGKGALGKCCIQRCNLESVQLAVTGDSSNTLVARPVSLNHKPIIRCGFKPQVATIDAHASQTCKCRLAFLRLAGLAGFLGLVYLVLGSNLEMSFAD